MSSDDGDADGASSPRKRGLGTFLTNSMLNMMSTPIMEGDEEETDSDDSDFGVEADKPSEAGMCHGDRVCVCGAADTYPALACSCAL